ncbi:hypothetical protein BDW02DRAFT_5526 [Decorospora gaudefroyi]|uniref:C2H2-type domain-containing protein n=1 Tax=Decorospora gaudefroyi TaxID=184978 RepID=A0A6A5KTP4_9PLEO|nr:hypothetical protein BDW02DRAFT_5526 [Decorospora gaudefroyi]
MTHRSSKPHQPKTTTISRRLRDRADLHLSVQPPEFPQIRSVRPRRAATLPTPRHNPSDYQTAGTHTDSLAWNTSLLLTDTSPNDTPDPTNLAQARSHNLLLAQQLEFQPRDASGVPDSGLATLASGQTSRVYQAQPTQTSDFLQSPLPSVSGSHDFELQLSTDPDQPHGSFLELQDMSTLGFMMAPSQYGMNHYGSSQTSYSPGYPPQLSYAEQRSSNSGGYGSSYASSPALPHENQQRRHEQQTVLPPYQPQHTTLPRSPYQHQQAVDSMRGNASPMASSANSYTYPAPHNSIPSQSLGSITYPPYVYSKFGVSLQLISSSAQIYPPTTYSVSEYHPLPTMYPPSSTTPAAYPTYESSQSAPTPPSGAVPALSSSPGTQSNSVMPRVLNSRPKPQCWEHGCNGRQFSTFSNLLRHQREKSGTASKSSCPRCGAEFTRTTARNGHMAHDKCKPRRPSETSG